MFVDGRVPAAVAVDIQIPVAVIIPADPVYPASQQVAQGHFGSASDAIRAGLRLLEEREAKLSLLRRALVEGEESGTAEYSVEGLLAELDSEGAH